MAGEVAHPKYQGRYIPVSDFDELSIEQRSSVDEARTLETLSEVLGRPVHYSSEELKDLDTLIDQGHSVDPLACATFLGNLLCQELPTCHWSLHRESESRSLQLTEGLEWPIDKVIATKIHVQKGLLRAAHEHILNQTDLLP